MIENNAGPELVLPISTPDIDPLLSVSTDPPGESRTAGTDLILDQAGIGQFQKVRVELSSLSLAPLELRTVCLLNRDGRCADDARTSGAYRICGGDVDAIEGCAAPRMDTILRQDETTVLTIFYSPPMDQTGVLIGQVLIESNDSLAPQYQIEMRGQVCTALLKAAYVTDVEMGSSIR